MFKSFKEMPVWQEAMKIAEEIFNLTEKFPKKEDYGLTSQLRRAALSISANIAEAYGRNHTSDKINFYYFARGSATETQSHLEYAKRVGYFNMEAFKKIDQELSKLYNDLNKIIISLKAN
ncbi:MAG: four helix bundle protein [Candidatus Omnitrophica bacterium]|nr:four helix bundle protein [Candidatus Omnitrophota bacterium]